MRNEQSRTILRETRPELPEQFPFVPAIPSHCPPRLHLIREFQQTNTDDPTICAVESRFCVRLIVCPFFCVCLPCGKEVISLFDRFGSAACRQLANQPCPFFARSLDCFNIQHHLHCCRPRACPRSASITGRSAGGNSKSSS